MKPRGQFAGRRRTNTFHPAKDNGIPCAIIPLTGQHSSDIGGMLGSDPPFDIVRREARSVRRKKDGAAGFDERRKERLPPAGFEFRNPD
jgi:hypothetical protein